MPMANLHNDVTYKGWDKNPTAFHRECIEVPNSCYKGGPDCYAERPIFSENGTRKVGASVSQSNCCTGTWLVKCMAAT